MMRIGRVARMRRMWRVAGARAATMLAIALLARPAGAQQKVAGTMPVVRDTRDSRRADTPEPAPAPVASVRVSGAPRSFQMTRIPVPASIPDSVPVRWEATPVGGVSLLGARQGSLPAGAGRSAAIIVGIPSRARAGKNIAAEVRFITPDGQVELAHVEVDVSVMRALQVQFLQDRVGVKSARVVRIPYRVSNNGNAADTARLHLTPPSGWVVKSADLGHPIVLDPGAVAERELTLVAAREQGAYLARLATMRDTSPESIDQLFIDVSGGGSLANRSGLALYNTIGVTGGSNGGTSLLVTYALRGLVYNDIGTDIGFATTSSMDSRSRYRLNSLGLFPNPVSAAIYGPTWRVQGGAVGTALSEITGMNTGGRGGSVHTDLGRYRLDLLLASPNFAQVDTTQGRIYNALVRVSRLFGSTWLTGTATTLEDGTFSGLTRTLDAYAVGINRRRGNGPELTSELAFRRFGEGEGLGFQFGYNAIGETRRRTQVNVAYAPGGTSAFAMARLNATAALTRGLSERAEFDANGWYTDDAGLQGGLRSTNWGALVAPRIQLGNGLLLALEGSSRLQSLGTALSEVGYAEHRVGSRLTLTHGGFTYAAGGSSAIVSRSVKLDSSSVNRSFPRFTINGAVSRGTVRYGAWSVTADLTDDRTNTLTLPRQGVLGIGFSQLPLNIPGVSMRLTGLAQRFAWFGDRPAAWALRGDLSMDVPLGFQLGLSVDRRPFEAIAGAGTWSTSIRVSRSGGIPIPTPFGRGKRSGYVYQDLNGNGRRDRDEPGLAGVIVKRDKEVVSTDESGRFRFGEIPTGAIPTTVALDPRSIPMGWVDPGVPLDPEVAKRVKEIGVIPTANVRVEIVVDERDGGVVGKIDVTRALVTAKDSLGRLWNSTVDASSRFVFPALPPGRYALDVNVEGVGDQLTLREPAPSFVVTEKRDATTLRVTLSPRRVRMFKAGSRPATTPAANSGDGKVQAPAAAPATVMPGEPMVGTPPAATPPATRPPSPEAP